MQGTAPLHGLQASLIRTGGVIKDDPGTNPIDLIYQTNATPVTIDPGVPKVYTPINTNTDPNPAPAEAAPNIAAVDAPAEKNNTVLILAAAGLGALLLFSKDGKKAVNGIAGIGKKKTSILPLLLVGGAAAAWYFMQEPAITPIDSTTNVTPVDETPVNTPVPITNNPPPIVTPVEVADVARSYTAQADLTALQRDWPAMATKISTFTDTEIIKMYNYFYNYVLAGKKLYRLPNASGIFPDGGWDTDLYDWIAAIKIKYAINF